FSIEIPQMLLACFALLTVADIGVLLFNKRKITSERIIADRLSNGDKNPVTLRFTNNYAFAVKLEIIEELPFQFQARNNSFQLHLAPFASDKLRYFLRPIARGEYDFGHTVIFVNTR